MCTFILSNKYPALKLGTKLNCLIFIVNQKTVTFPQLINKNCIFSKPKHRPRKKCTFFQRQYKPETNNKKSNMDMVMN